MTERDAMQAGPMAASDATSVHRVTTPLPWRPREVHAYLLESAGGHALVDGGANTAEAWAALDSAVHAVAGGWDRVHAHVVTHMHLDHFGLARRVREACGAPLLMHRLDAERAAHAEADPQEEAEYRAQLLRESGAPEELLRAFGAGRGQEAPQTGFVPAQVMLDGESGALESIEGWKFVWTPGHTAGHVSLFRAADRLLVAGDAVLDRITPTIGVNRQRADPVGDYLDALDRLAALEPRLILAGHGAPIAEPLARIEALRAATLQESERIAAGLGPEPRTAWEVARLRHVGRDLPPAVQMLALREALAHLQHLEAEGAVRRIAKPGGPTAFALARAGTAPTN